MPKFDHLYAHVMALFLSTILVAAFLGLATVEALLTSPSPSRLSVLDSLGFLELRTKVPGYLTIIVLGLLLATVSNRPKKQKLAPGIPVVGGSGLQQVKESRKRFIHDGKSMIEEGYRQVG